MNTLDIFSIMLLGVMVMAIAVFVVSIVILHEGRLFNKTIPWLGILASLLTFANHLGLLRLARWNDSSNAV